MENFPQQDDKHKPCFGQSSFGLAERPQGLEMNTTTLGTEG